MRQRFGHIPTLQLRPDTNWGFFTDHVIHNFICKTDESYSLPLSEVLLNHHRMSSLAFSQIALSPNTVALAHPLPVVATV